MARARPNSALRTSLVLAGSLSVSLIGGCYNSSNAVNPPSDASAQQVKKVIVFVWDGLRPDSIDPTITPNLAALRDQQGVNFSDNHSTYPTFTMMNGASFATGSFPGTTGFYGNTLYAPGATGNNSAGAPVDFSQPVFTEDYAILQDLDKYYNNQLFLVGTLFQAAQAAGLKTAAIGKSGAAFIQDYKKGGIILDEKMVYPLSLAQELQQNNYVLPKLTPVAYTAGTVSLAVNNGDPTAFGSVTKLADTVTSDPRAAQSAYNAANQYMMDTYCKYILPKKNPDLTMIWFRNPDSTEHNYGPGSAGYVDALKSQDALLGELQAQLKALGQDKDTDIIVVSDHGHSNVAGDATLFPLRGLTGSADGTGAIGGLDPNGYSVSGEVRTADLMTRAGFTDVYDGSGCTYDPVLSGIKADGIQVYPDQTDTSGSVCGKAGTKYTTANFKVPATLPTDAIVIVPNGGSEYFYVPSKDPNRIASIVNFLQSREQYGAVFVDSHYGNLPGTLPLSTIKVENTAGRNPDIVVSFNFDENAKVNGLPGTEYESMFNNRGMHGSFSPIDVHNTLIAAGPDFKATYTDAFPSGNVDVAPTVAKILGLSLPQADGRPLLEALANGNANYQSVSRTVAPASSATGLQFKLPTDPSGAAVDTGKSSYTVQLQTKVLTDPGGKSYTYFDYAKAVRQ